MDPQISKIVLKLDKPIPREKGEGFRHRNLSASRVE